MEGVFRESDEVKVDYAYYECHEPKRGDIVIVNVGRKETELMKIISAVPGDLWDMQQQDDGVYRIVVNGGPLYTKTNGMYQIPAERAVMLQKYAKGYNQTIPPETILVLGNDPGGSYDSSVFGLISTKSLRGRVITRSKF